MNYFFTPENRKIALGYGSFLDHMYEVQQSDALASRQGKPVQRFPKSAQGFFQAFDGTYGMPNEGSAISRPATGWLIESGDQEP
jgi:hypothetical protein